jgi:branched-chain amino acid transport system substrate-binding protein
MVGFALLAAACTDDADDSVPTTTVPTTSTSVSEVTATTVPEGEGLTVGLLAPGPGLVDELFVAQRRGMSFAAADVTAGGGVLGGALAVEEASASVGTPEAALLGDLADRGAGVFAGPVASSSAPAMLEELTARGSLACSASASLPSVTYGQEELALFRTVIPDDVFVGQLAEKIVERRDEVAPGAGWTINIVARDDDYGQTVGGGLASALEAQGLAPNVVSYHPYTVIFTDTAAAVAARPAELTVLVSYEEGPRLLRALVDAGVAANTMVGLDGFFVPRLPEITDAGNPGTVEGFTVMGSPGDRAFLERLVADDPRGQVAYAAQAYDCGIVLALAAEAVELAEASSWAEAVRSVTAAGRTCTTYADCVEKLRAGENIDYDGVTGRLEIDERGDPTFARFAVGRWEGGSLTEVSAEDIDFAQLQRYNEIVASATFVTKLQVSLRVLGFYDGPIDGIYDDDVTEAVRAFQQSVGLEPTGVYDEATDAALRERLGGSASLITGSTLELQQALTDLGRYSGPIDGRWNQEMTDAIKGIQRDLGVPETGILDVATLRAIYDQGVESGSTTTTTAPPTPETTPAPTTAAPTTTVAPPASAPRLIEVLEADPEYSTFLAALRAAGFDKITLAPGIEITAFAPVNAAFEALPPGTVDGLLGDVPTLRSVLAYHFAFGSFTVAGLTPGELRTVHGAPLEVTGGAADLRVGGAAIVKPDTKVANGYLQGIDTVLLPPGVTLPG